MEVLLLVSLYIYSKQGTYPEHNTFAPGPSRNQPQLVPFVNQRFPAGIWAQAGATPKRAKLKQGSVN